MTESALSFARVFAIQLRLALARGWRARAIGLGLILVQLVAMVLFGAVLGISVNREGVTFAQLVDLTNAFEVPLTRAGAGLLLCLGALSIIAWFGPFRLWEDEPPSRRDYHWAMPVAKARHDLARVLAGAVLLLGWALVLYGCVLILALAGGAGHGLAEVSPALWLCFLLGPLPVYLLTSSFTVRLEHPSGWLWSILGALAAIMTLSSLLPLAPLARLVERVLMGPWGLLPAVGGPVAAGLLGLDAAAPRSWPAVWLLWVVVLSLAVVWGAHDRRRMP